MWFYLVLDRYFFEMQKLTSRQKKILYRIVQSYVDTATAVGSSHLVRHCGLDWSSATIRGEMVNLESMGYIEQPHTSAGRIPTDRAYRFYVSRINNSKRVHYDVKDKIQDHMGKAGRDVNGILDETSKILSKISRELSVVLTPWLDWGIFDRLELIKLSHKKVLVVIHVRSRSVKTVIMETESDLDIYDLEKTTRLLNERLSGLTLEEIRTTIKDRIEEVQRGDKKLLRQMIVQADELFHFAEPVSVHTSGAKDILSQPEFSDINMLERLFSLIDDKESLIELFHKKGGEVEVMIGRENQDDRLNAFTVIKASYNRGKDIGTFGIIGPTRMPYNRILPLVDFVARSMSQCLS